MVRYSDELIDEIRNSNDIVDVISQYVTLKRSGRNFFGLCPFHKEKSPSFSVSPDKQIFHCFGCGVGGNVIHFISKIENIDFRETLEVLAERSGISLPTLESSQDNKLLELKTKVYEINMIAAEFYHENLYKPTSKEAQEYIKKRKLGNNTLKSFLIGYSGTYDELYRILKSKGYTENEILASSLVNKTENGKFIDRFRKRLMFPILDVRGRVIAFGGRVLDDSKPKYINSPENIVYSKGRHLFGLNVAKKSDLKQIIIVEGYMDVISLHQRGVTNVVASLGTALTEAQGRLLRKHSEQVVLGYDSDGAGQAATVRGLEILQSLGADVRILQIEDAKDPDEYIIKFGSGRFLKAVENSISLVEYKVKLLKNTLNINNTSDKIKFLNEIAKILSKVDNNIEKEIYIEKISEDYRISKEAIHAEINKLKYKKDDNIKKINYQPKVNNNEEIKAVSPLITRRENMIISLLLAPENNAYEKLKNVISVNNFKFKINKQIAEKIYEEYESGNLVNIENNILNSFQDEEIINHITQIMADDFEITDINKCIEDLLNIYTKEKIIDDRNEILKALENENLSIEQKTKLEAELKEIIIKLAKMK
ncbi:MAG: DNA primase [Clostridia bacterium]|nr:DNA primase [Clostridia bacterium]